jgi:hypothetical protein
MSALIDSHRRLQIEYNNRPIRDANSKNSVTTLLMYLLDCLKVSGL